MLKAGLCTVTFSKKPIEEVLDLTEKAGLGAIECFGGCHAGPGDIEKARMVKAACAEKGIDIPSYGSYYRTGVGGKDGETFESVLETAVELGCGNIRVWAGDRNFGEADSGFLSKAAEDTLRIADMAKRHDMTVSFEFHKGSLTDTNENALKFAEMVDRANVKFYWQPPNGESYNYCMEGLEMLGERLGNVHVFHWTVGSPNENKVDPGNPPKWPDDFYRHNLEQGRGLWYDYLKYVNGLEGSRYCFLEFVKDDSAENFIKDAATLTDIINSLDN